MSRSICVLRLFLRIMPGEDLIMKIGVTAVMLPELNFGEQIDLCHELGIMFYQYRPRVIDPGRRDEAPSNWGVHRFDLTPERLAAEGARLTQQLRDAGLHPAGTAPVCPIELPDEQIAVHVKGAAAAEAGCVRIGLSTPPGIFDYSEHLQRVKRRLGEIIEHISGPAGVKLVFETHANSFGSSPSLALNICQPFSPAQIGVIFDLSNFAREGELKPNLAVSILRNYIDHVHIGGSRRVEAERDALGFRQIKYIFCAMRDSDIHLPTWLHAMNDANLDVPLIIEDFDPTLSGPDRLRRSIAELKMMAPQMQA